MKKTMKIRLNDIKQTILVTAMLLLICGFIYPLLMTGLAQLFFPHQAAGSLIEVNGTIVGSELIGQDFTEDYYMKCRPSAINYNTYTQAQKDSGEYSGVGSGSANLAPTNPKLVARVSEDMQKFLERNTSVKREDIPTDLMTASGSGLDPHISPASATIQLNGIAQASGLTMETLVEIVGNNTKEKSLGIFGEANVNVLGVNLEIASQMALD